MFRKNIFYFRCLSEIIFALLRCQRVKEEVEITAKTAGIHEDIIAFLKVMILWSASVAFHFPGGQKQRLSIARALLIQPKILILDDALSAVDAKTEQLILSNLKALRHESSTLVVSHRLSSVMEANEIIVLDEGKVIERGLHEAFD